MSVDPSTRLPTGAYNRIFDIPEVLEAILLNVDMRSLIVSAQRVCKYWYRLISSSPLLQQHLFIAADFDVPRTINPLLKDVFPFCFPEHKFDFKVYWKSEDIGIEDGFQQERLSSPHILRKPLAFSRAQASWRRMLIQQPPLRELGSLVTVAPDHRVLLTEARLPDTYMVAGEFLPSYVRMPDLLALALAPMDISFPHLPEGPVAIHCRVLWHPHPPIVNNRGTDDLIGRMISDYGVVVHNIGRLEPSLPLKTVSTLRKILLRHPDHIYATNTPI